MEYHGGQVAVCAAPRHGGKGHGDVLVLFAFHLACTEPTFGSNDFEVVVSDGFVP